MSPIVASVLRIYRTMLIFPRIAESNDSLGSIVTFPFVETRTR